VSEGENSRSSGEVEGEGGEDFYIARSGKRPDLLVTGGGFGWVAVGFRGKTVAVIGCVHASMYLCDMV
jgi:hypothetical protein